MENVVVFISDGYRLNQACFTALTKKHWANLHLLRLIDCALNSDTIKAISRSHEFDRLHSLFLIADDIEDAGLQAMAESGMLSNLKILSLRGNRFGDRAIEVLVNSNPPRNLTSLNLRHNQIGDCGAVALANSEILTKIKYLNLSNNQIGDRGAIALANSSRLKEVTKLYLRSNSISIEGLKAILNSSQLERLKILGMGRNKLTTQELEIGLDAGFKTAHRGHIGELTKPSILIRELTPSQEALIPFYIAKWLKVASSTTQISQERAIKIIGYFYTFYLRRKKPRIVFCQNPSETLKTLKKLHRNREDRILCRGRMTGWEIQTNLYRKLWSELTKEIWWKLRFTSLDDLTQEKLQEFLAQNKLKVVDRYKRRWDNKIDIDWFYTDLNPEYWVGYNSFNDFCISVLHCDYDRKDWAMLRAIARHFCWTIFYQDLSIVCLRPRESSFE